ncbi:MAG: DNA polymerase III subunit delta' [Candidatus Omnitrophica bacterium]|nr:DNA polymerase III subunit delta' [Candidatus Omnitrophota bacterium]
MGWDDLLGHESAKRLLRAHAESGRMAGAYLLVGPEGVGKRRLAREMAKALNCTAQGPRPCDACAVCRQIDRNSHPDVHGLAPGGASDQIKIDDVRGLLGRIALHPFSAATQVVIIDGAERLTEEAANALLKTLEEPNPHTRFLLTSAHVADCLPTIRSRCQLIRCDALPADAIARIVIGERGCEPQVAESVARIAGGSASGALALAARWTRHQQIAAQLADDAPSAWAAHPLPETREEVAEFLDDLMQWLRDLAVVDADPAHLVYAEHAERLRRQARAFDRDRCIETALELVALRDSLEQFVSPRLVAALAREKWLELLKGGGVDQ